MFFYQDYFLRISNACIPHIAQY